MENLKYNAIEFKDKQLNELCHLFISIHYNNQNVFAKTCFTIYSIWSYCKGNYFQAKNNEYYNSYKLLEKFGFDRKAVSRYKNCFERFIQGSCIENVTVKTYFYDFTPSKLFELLPLSYDTIENLINKKFIRSDMTVKEIRDYVKTFSSGEKVEKVVEEIEPEIDEEEIPFAYDPTKEYEF